MHENPALWTLAEQGQALRARTLKIGELLARQEERIRRFNARYRAFSYLAGDTAKAAATLQRALGRRRDRGPLHGIAVSVKGSLPVAGLPWTEGSRLYADRVAESDAEIVAAARKAGGIVLGTTTLSELAMYAPDNPAEPLAVNPWAEERTSGGSSSGAGVAAALGMATVNIGTDAGGSGRNPACHSGVVGFMASIGALPAGGKVNYCPSLSAMSLLTRRVADADAAFWALREAAGLAGPPAKAPRPGRRLLVLAGLIEEMCDAATKAIFARARERLTKAGFALIDADIPGWIAGERAAGVVSLAECGAVLATLDLARASASIRARAERAKELTAGEVGRARDACRALADHVATALARNRAEAIATPTWPFAAPPIKAEAVEVGGRPVPVDPHRNCFVRGANAINACAITLPAGVYPAEKVPAGLQLMAPAGADAALLALAAEVEAALPPAPLPPVG
ncbi:MAG: amidase [Proteobacteria bacterium]|nr:amidase [Pseudomonadota bacterium]